MQSQNELKNNKRKRNIKKTAYILYLLKLAEITQQDIARELGITRQVVCRVISGEAKSRKISTWFKNNLGVEI